ncbi:MAG: hypothetical protein ACE5K1_12600 [Acidiferrobacterales bacterium]
MAKEDNLPGSGVSTRPCKRVVLAALVGMVYMAPAHAYLDPGTGSIILQSLLAGIAAAMAIAGMYWQRIKAFFSSLFASKKLTDPNPEQDTEN